MAVFDFLSAKVVYINGEYERAAKLFLEGARDGSVEASFAYGYCLLYGIGVAPDPEEAKSFFSFARNMQGGEAAYNLAVMYMHGLGVKRNYKKSFEYMESAAHLGCIEAKLYLGMAYTTGYWLEPDIISISVIPYHKPDYRISAEYMLTGEVPDAQLDEELRFSVVSADGRQAFEWFREAARHDPTYVSDLVAKGQFLYAKCFLDGLGTDFDRDKGTRIMLLAGKSGSEDAINFLAEHGVNVAALLKGGENK